MSKPLVSFVIVNWNGKNFLKKCLQSVFNQSYKNFEVIVVDNGSVDGSIEFVREKYPQIKLICNGRNLGLTAACNIGFRHAKGEYIAELNNDITIEKDWLKKILSKIGKDKKNVCAEGALVEKSVMRVILGSLNIFGDNTIDVFDDATKKFYATGGGMLIKSKLFKQYYDPDYNVYKDDVYIGWRLRLNGYEILRVPEAKMLHLGSASTSRNPFQFTFLSERNKMINFFLFYETGNLIKLLPLFLTFNIVWSVVEMFRNRVKGLARIKSILWILTNLHSILEKRKKIQDERKVPDKEIVSMLSSRVIPDKYRFAKTVNQLVTRYCSITGIKTYESLQSN